MSKKGGIVCCVRGCSTSSTRHVDDLGKNISLFRFPKDPQRSRGWLTAADRHDLQCKTLEQLYKNYRLCGLHFEEGMFLNRLKNRLRSKAVPTICFHSKITASDVSEDICSAKHVAKNVRKRSADEMLQDEKDGCDLLSESKIKLNHHETVKRDGSDSNENKIKEVNLPYRSPKLETCEEQLKNFLELEFSQSPVDHSYYKNRQGINKSETESISILRNYLEITNPLPVLKDDSSAGIMTIMNTFKNLPPDLQVLAKNDIVQVLQKYKMLALNRTL